MLYISLDESGKIEEASKNNGKNKPVLIGGLIYDDHNQSGDYANEKRRIDLYLRAVCAHEKAMMPEDLHFDDKGTATEVNRVRELIHKTLGDFLKKGICSLDDNRDNEYSCELKDKTNMPPRKGEYHLFIYLKYGDGMETLLDKGLSNLVKDDVASNLYEHMISEILGRVLFHNPVIENVKSVKLDLPTRIRPVKIVSENETKDEYDKLGYKGQNKGQNDGFQVTYTVADSDIYRTILEREMMRSRHMDIQIEGLSVRSIPYKPKNERDINTESYAFLYLTDLICDIQTDRSSPQTMIESFKNRVDDLTGHGKESVGWNMVFAYDEIDLIYQEAYEKLEQRDYYEVLCLIYEGEHLSSPYAKFYNDVWFSCLRQSLQSESDTNAYSIALRKLYLSSRRNNLDQEELLKLYQGLEAMKENIKFASEEDKEAVLYELYDAGTSAFDHIGDSERAEKCYEKCEEYSENVELERYLRTRNKKVVFLTDSFRFAEALEVAEEDEAVQESLLDVRDLIFKTEKVSKDYGMALSQMGQTLSFMHDRKAEQKFLDALKWMGEEGTSDYNQTLSYLLHYYLEMGEKEKYEKFSTAYFGGKTTLKDQFRYIVQEGKKGAQAVISMKFAMYVFIKGIYLFKMDDHSKDLKGILENIEKRIFEIGGEEAVKQMKGHPWEIIYKYLALALKDRGSEKGAEAYMNKAEEVLDERGYTLDAICLFGNLEYVMKCEKIEAARNILEQLAQLFKENRCKVYKSIDNDDVEGTYEYLKNYVMGYMYS